MNFKKPLFDHNHIETITIASLSENRLKTSLAYT